MSLELWAAFVAASVCILILPGPVIITVISQAAAYGRTSVVPLVAGVVLGDFTAMTLSIVGLGALISASAVLFSVFKWIGACYLVYLGIGRWRASREETSTQAPHTTRGPALFRSSYIVAASNPKSIAFFVAFLPQFVNPQQPAAQQFPLLMGTFLLLSFTNAGLLAFFSGTLRETLQSSAFHRWVNRCGGTALIGAGIFTAAMKQT
ncbi:MAG: LysE family translocator [Synergistales bacterium]|nr:LysE family translocator [Synergistales bacterium]